MCRASIGGRAGSCERKPPTVAPAFALIIFYNAVTLLGYLNLLRLTQPASQLRLRSASQ